MARARIRRSVKRSKDLIWVTTMIEASILENTPTDICIAVTPSDWSGGNIGFDRATLMSVRGWISYSQQAAATAAEATGMYLALYLTDVQVAANAMDPSNATEYSAFDTLWTDGMSLTATTGTAGPFLARQLDVRSRRRMTTQTDVRIAAQVSADTAGAPRVNFNGCVRSLLRLDPP